MTRDDYLTNLWRTGATPGPTTDGWTRRQDGKLAHTTTGEPCAGLLAIPETSLPPLPDATRPRHLIQIIGVDPEPLKTHTAPPWVKLRRAGEQRRQEALEHVIATETDAAPSDAHFTA